MSCTSRHEEGLVEGFKLIIMFMFFSYWSCAVQSKLMPYHLRLGWCFHGFAGVSMHVLTCWFHIIQIYLFHSNFRALYLWAYHCCANGLLPIWGSASKEIQSVCSHFSHGFQELRISEAWPPIRSTTGCLESYSELVTRVLGSPGSLLCQFLLVFYAWGGAVAFLVILKWLGWWLFMFSFKFLCFGWGPIVGLFCKEA